MYLDPPLFVRLKRHLRDHWAGYVVLFLVALFLWIFELAGRPPLGGLGWLWFVSPLAYEIAVYVLCFVVGVSGIFVVAAGLYWLFTGKMPFRYRTNRDLLEIRPKRSTRDPKKDPGDESN
jgi:hypothetical protein